MSGAIPTSPNFAAINLKSNDKTVLNKTANGKRQVSNVAGHNWEFTMSYPVMTRSEFAPIWAFIESQYGRYDTFTVIPSDLATPLGTIAGSTVVNQIHTAGDTTIFIDGLTAGTTFLAGSVLKFANHNKVYLNTADTTAGDNDALELEDQSFNILLENGSGVLLLESAGQITATIKPALTTALANDEVVTVNNVPFTVALKSDIQSYRVDAPMLYKFEIDVEEVL